MAAPGAGPPGDGWPDSIPAGAHLLTHGLDLPAGVTFLVGENGAGKSTIVEAIAEVLGIPGEGGASDHQAGAERGRGTDRSDLSSRLRAVRGAGAGLSRAKGRGRGKGFFLRAETMHRFVTYLEDADGGTPHPLHGVSHGESFVEMLTGRWVRQADVVLLDEPESALSFANCLTLASELAAMAAAGKQVVCATHSPLLTALPDANVLQLDDDGIAEVAWEDLRVVQDWRAFLDGPMRYLRHVL